MTYGNSERRVSNEVSEKMKAVVCTSYGPPEVLHLEEVEKPVPKDNQVLIRILATTVATGDCELRSFKMPSWLWLFARMGFGIRGPRKRILGQELAGEIEARGKDVKLFAIGDHVFATTGFELGTYAEYTCLAVGGVIAPSPRNIKSEQAAALPLGGLTALHFIREAGIQRGQSVLIIGAGGSIGTFAVQIAKYFGATVTAVDSADKLEMIRSVGADRVIDYKKEEYTNGGETYDVIFDIVGKSSFSQCISSLKQNGRYLLGNPGLSQMVRGPWTSMRGKRKVIFGAGRQGAEDLRFLKELIEEGKIRSVIDRCYPLEQIVEAHRYVETGRKKGNVVITLQGSAQEYLQSSTLQRQEI